MKKLLFIALLAGVSLIVSAAARGLVLHGVSSGLISKDVSDRPKWGRYKFSGITLELPSIPREQALNLPEAVRKISLTKAEISNFGGVSVLVTYIYSHEPFDPNASIGEVIRQYGENRNISGLKQIETTDVLVAGLSGRKSTATYAESGKPMQLTVLVFTKGIEAWSIVAAGPEALSQNITKIVINSIEMAP